MLHMFLKLLLAALALLSLTFLAHLTNLNIDKEAKYSIHNFWSWQMFILKAVRSFGIHSYLLLTFLTVFWVLNLEWWIMNNSTKFDETESIAEWKKGKSKECVKNNW
jgi:hypothetical protein